MADYSIINKETWSRKGTYNYFKEFELPFFNITANVDVTNLKLRCDEDGHSYFLTSLFFAMKAANDISEFKLRIHEEEVIQYNAVRVGSTIQYDDHSFGFCYFPYLEFLDEFLESGKELLEKSHAEKSFEPKDGSDDLLHFSVIPWLHFNGFKHARRIGKEDSIPKIVFGKYELHENKLLMPVNVEVHHALADGYHVGRFFEKFQEYIIQH